MEIRLDQIDPDALHVVQRLRRYQHKAYLVGGCVRDLLLGLKPKDFDVATSATPNEIRRCFRNCRIIGRRFRLAHVFFGRKIIETATFRANPRTLEEESGDAPADVENQAETQAETKPENSDLLIRRDNVFGTAEEDARRRDFTINGLFFDVDTAQVIDHVAGLPDLEARLVRTIGDPDIRFREDPIRILRAVKFAARCNLAIEPETYRLMMEHKAELAKCAQPRVTEEFYRLLRGGAARRSFELLVETGLLEFLLPEMAQAWRAADDDPQAKARIERFWAYLRALDESIAARGEAPSDAMILATLLLPPLRDVLAPDGASTKNVGQVVAQSVQPILDRLKASRRDSELCRQILLTVRYLLPSTRPQRSPSRLAGRPFFQDALWLSTIVARAEGWTPVDAGTVAETTGATTPELGATEAAPEEELPTELLADADGDGGRGRLRRHGQRGRQARPEAPVSAEARGPATRPVAEPARGPATNPATSPAARLEKLRPWEPGSAVRTPIPDLAELGPLPLPRPAFLGRGTFGGRWAARTD
jgi:poly(A) polymerase